MIDRPFRILLVDAIGAWLARADALKHVEQVVLPVGLMSISAVLKQRFGSRITVRVVHGVVDCPDAGSFQRELDTFNPDLVGIRGLHIYRKKFAEYARISREHGVPHVIGGGPFVTSDPAAAIQVPNLDAAISGEGEESFTVLIDRILGGSSYDDIPGLVMRTPDGIRINPPSQFITDLDSLPDPDYSVIDLDAYHRFMTYGYNRRRQGVILSSRGCPYHCVYCHNIFGRRFRMRSADRVVAEIERLHGERNIRDFYFIDDNFNMDVDRVQRFCDLMIARKLPVNLYFTNGVRGDRLTPELIDRLILAGTVWFTFAVETASRRLQTLIKKHNDLDLLERNIHHACNRGVMCAVCFMIGFPTETEAEAQSTIEYVGQFKKSVLPMFFSVKYYPNTAIHEMALAHGINLERSGEAFDETYHDISHSGTPLIPPKSFQTLYFRFLKDVFLSRERLVNALEIQRRYLSEEELLDAYSLFFRRRIRNIENEVLKYAR